MKSLIGFALLAGTLAACVEAPGPSVEVRWQLLDGTAPAKECSGDGEVWIHFKRADGSISTDEAFQCLAGDALVYLNAAPGEYSEVCIVAGRTVPYYDTCGGIDGFCNPGPSSYPEHLSGEACGVLAPNPQGDLFDVTLQLLPAARR